VTVTPHKATPEQWVNLERRQLGGNDLVCAALELRARVEALEDDSWKQAESTQFCVDALVKRIEALEANSKPTPNPSQIRSSLVERVSCAIDGRINPDQWLHQDAARAAIREQAAWLRSQGLSTGDYWAERLESEAGR
jgi:hypothetical protein